MVHDKYHVPAFDQPLQSDSAAGRMEIVLICKTSIESKTEHFCHHRRSTKILRLTMSSLCCIARDLLNSDLFLSVCARHRLQ